MGGCRKAGGGKSETGAALSGRAQVWPDKVYQTVPAANRRCGAGLRALAGGCAQADSAFPVLSGGLVSQRAGEREMQREREGGKEAAFQLLHPDDKSQGQEVSSQPYEQLGRGPMEVRARGSGFSRGPAFQAPEQACCPSAVLQGLKKKSPWGSLGGSVVKTLPTGAGDTGSIPDAGRSHVQQSS